MIDWKVKVGVTIGELESVLKQLSAEGWSIFQVCYPGIGIIAWKMLTKEITTQAGQFKIEMAPAKKKRGRPRKIQEATYA